MQSQDNKTTLKGLTLTDVVQVIFIILKLTKLIDWPWTVVLIPLWIELGLIAILLACVLIMKLKDK